MSTAGESLRVLRERKPLVHQITNYVVMNETANATLALGALPVMAHAPEEVEEMVGLAGALVLNIGTLSPHWVEAMLAAGPRGERARRPGRARPGRRRRDARTAPTTAQRILDEVEVAVLRGNAGEVATLVGVAAEVRGVESIGDGGRAGRARARGGRAALGVVASVTGPVDHVSDGERAVAIANGDPLLATITGTGCMSSAITGCFLAVAESPFDAAVEALVAFGVAGEDAARGAKGPGHASTSNLYDALAALDPATLDGRARVVVRVHAIVETSTTARRAVEAGATVVQLRVKAPTAEVVARGEGFRGLGDDLRRQRRRRGGARARRRRRPPRPVRPRRRAGAAPRAAARPLGHELRGGGRGRRRLPRRRPGLGDAVEGRRRPAARARRARPDLLPRRRCRWSRSAGSTPSNAAACIRAGAAGVAVIRAATDPALARAVDEALRAR